MVSARRSKKHCNPGSLSFHLKCTSLWKHKDKSIIPAHRLYKLMEDSNQPEERVLKTQAGIHGSQRHPWHQPIGDPPLWSLAQSRVLTIRATHHVVCGRRRLLTPTFDPWVFMLHDSVNFQTCKWGCEYRDWVTHLFWWQYSFQGHCSKETHKPTFALCIIPVHRDNV